jgi:hypothetical protein
MVSEYSNDSNGSIYSGNLETRLLPLARLAARLLQEQTNGHSGELSRGLQQTAVEI